MPEVKEIQMPFPPLGYVKMKMLVVTDEDIANCDTKCENCMKVRLNTLTWQESVMIGALTVMTRNGNRMVCRNTQWVFGHWIK